jgi:hypothetical protein
MINKKAYLKAGLIGGAISLALAIINKIPLLNCTICLMIFAFPMAIGFFAAHLAGCKRNDSSEALKQGAIAALIANSIWAVLDGIVGAIVGLLTGLTTGGVVRTESLISALVGSLICLGVNAFLGVFLGALGGYLKTLTSGDENQSNFETPPSQNVEEAQIVEA